MSHFSANDRRKIDYSYTGLVSRHTIQGGTIIPKRYVWVGDADFSTGVGLVNGVDGKKGLLGTYNGTTTIDINATNGHFQFGPDGKNVKYDGTDLTITGSNLVLSSGHYVWVGTPTTDGVGFTSNGLYAAIGGVNTVEISQSDGSFTFGKTSGSYLTYAPSSGTMTFHGPITSDVYNSYVTAATLGVYTTTETDGLLDGKINCYYQTSAPSSGVDSNDFWIDTDDDNKVYVYNGSSWEAVSNQDAVQALADAADAQDTADGKRTVFVATPTTPYSLGDLWKYDADTLYVCNNARATGAYVAGDWGKVATNGATWGVNIGGSNLPDDNATVGATAGTDLTRSNGSILHDADVITNQGTADDVEYGSGKAVYQYHADRTSLNTADNTTKINDAYAENSYDLHMYGGADIKFYSDNGNTTTGSIYSTSIIGQQIIAVDSEDYLYLHASKDIWIQPTSGYDIIAYADIIPSSNGNRDLGSSSGPKKWDYVYANYLGASGTKITSAYITTGNFSTVNTSYISATAQSTAAKYVNQTKENWFGHPDVGKKVKMVYYANPNDTTEAGHLWFYTSNAQS